MSIESVVVRFIGRIGAGCPSHCVSPKMFTHLKKVKNNYDNNHRQIANKN